MFVAIVSFFHDIRIVNDGCLARFALSSLLYFKFKNLELVFG